MNNFTKVAENFISQLEELKVSNGFWVKNYGPQQVLRLVREYPRVGDLRRIFDEIKKIEIPQDISYQEFREALRNASKVFKSIFLVFKENDMILVDRRDPDRCYNYTYYVCKFKNTPGGGRSWNEDQSYPVAYDLYFNERLPVAWNPEGLKDWIQEKATKAAEIKQARISRYQELSVQVAEKYSNEIVKLASRKKGQVLAFLSALAEEEFSSEAKELIKVSANADELRNLLRLVTKKVSPSKAYKIAKKAYAWAYIGNVNFGIEWEGHFDDARAALEKYADLNDAGPKVEDLAQAWGVQLKKTDKQAS